MYQFKEIRTLSLKVLEVVTNDTIMNTVSDALDVIGHAYFQGGDMVMVQAKDIPDDFFDLSSGLAGEILQKCSIFQMKIAIIGDFDAYRSQALQGFIRECNRGNHILFSDSKSSALKQINGTFHEPWSLS